VPRPTKPGLIRCLAQSRMATRVPSIYCIVAYGVNGCVEFGE